MRHWFDGPLSVSVPRNARDERVHGGAKTCRNVDRPSILLWGVPHRPFPGHDGRIRVSTLFERRCIMAFYFMGEKIGWRYRRLGIRLN